MLKMSLGYKVKSDWLRISGLLSVMYDYSCIPPGEHGDSIA